MEFKELINSLSTVNHQLHENSVRAVNKALTFRNWIFGYYIVEFEQNGADRAVYGAEVLSNISKEMKRLKIPNSDVRELRRCRQFYSAYTIAYDLIANVFPIRGTVSPELGKQDDLPVSSIRGTLSPEFQIPENHYVSLFNKLSYSHLVELTQIDQPIERLFYEIECIKSGWSIRELRRQIGSLLYQRMALSTDKEGLLATIDTSHENSAQDLIKDPYIFEFLGFKAADIFAEKELETRLIDNLMQFLLELGKGFCFEARQKRIMIDNEHYFVDLVFYHRTLHCNVLVELKTERFHYTHAGQLNMYLEYYRKYEMVSGDNPPIGILLCTSKDAEHVEFATAGMDDLFVSKYLVEMPNEKELEDLIKRTLKD